MKKWFWIILIFPLFANAGYQRNQAREVNQVVFGKVENVRYISQQDVVHSKANGWETLLGAIVGGLIGNQFGDGHGREVATAVGAIAGGSIAHSNANQEHRVDYRLVEILIKTKEGKWIDVIQDIDQNMLFEKNDNVRILYFDEGVRVDKEM